MAIYTDNDSIAVDFENVISLIGALTSNHFVGYRTTDACYRNLL